MRISIVGGGPAGLYFAILMKRADARHEVTVYERNRPDDTFGFGVVFSDATLGNLARADAASHAEITRRFAHWENIDTFIGGERFTSVGHGFCGLERKELLLLLQERCRELGVDVKFEHNIEDYDALRDSDLVIGADGVASGVRAHWASEFGPTIDDRPNRFVWLGTTFPFDAFTFYFKQAEAGLFRVHAYRYSKTGSTFIVECTDETFTRTGLDVNDEDGTIRYLEKVFAEELAGHPLIKNRSIWRNFPNIQNRAWQFDNVVLLGDAVHTAHFSIGSGTKLAMEDAITLADALAEQSDVRAALAAYEEARRPVVERTRRAAQVSLEWFENTERYMQFAPIQFVYSLLTRSLRVSHAKLKERDPALVERVERWLSGVREGAPPAPSEVGFEVGSVALANRMAALVGSDLPFSPSQAPAVTFTRDAAPSGSGVAAVVARPAEVAAKRGGGNGELLCIDAAGLSPSELGNAVADAGGGAPWVRVVATEETVEPLARQAREAGAAAIVVAAASGVHPEAGRFAAAKLSDRARQEVGLVTVAEAALESQDDIDSIIAAGRADLCLVGTLGV